jgi:hypothetical protein
VRIVHGFAPNGGSDIIGRLIGGWLSDRLGQPFVVESRPGDATNVATEAVIRADADGHTLLLATSPNATNATLYPNLKFNFIRDIQRTLWSLFSFAREIPAFPPGDLRRLREDCWDRLAPPGRLPSYGAICTTRPRMSISEEL